MESKFYSWSKNGNKMIINSKFKEFNKQTNYIGRGNVIANTIYGNYIRAWSETINPVGKKVEKGHLFNFDLEFFNISNHLKEYLKSLNQTVVLYEIFICKNGKKDIIGWIVENNGKIINAEMAKNRGDFLKRLSALETVRNIIEEKE